MANSAGIKWGRIALAALAAEALPILVLIAVVVAYSIVRSPDSRSPEAFAPLAGNWVGPIGGFLATLFFAWLTARNQPARPLAHGALVGVGTAFLDVVLGLALGGGEAASLIFVLSNFGRLIAGALGGWMASLRRPA